MIADALGVRVWELDRVALHYQEERRVLLMARYEAQMEIANKNKCSPEKIVLPEY